MKKTIIFILCISLASGAMQAYNQEATQKLQEKINKAKETDEIVSHSLLKEMEQLIKEGANPNTNPPMIEYIFHAQRQLRDVDYTLLETILKTALDNGADVIFTPHTHDIMDLALGGRGNAGEYSPTMIEMLARAGSSEQQKKQNQEAALSKIKRRMERNTKMFTEAKRNNDELQELLDSIEGKQPTKK